jgi:hypothetical protein
MNGGKHGFDPIGAKSDRTLVINRKAAPGLDHNAATAASLWLPHHPRHGGNHHDRTRDAACHAGQIGQSDPGPAAPSDAWTRSPANLPRSSVSAGIGDHDRSTCAHRPCPVQRADTAHGGDVHLAQPPDGGWALSGSAHLGARLHAIPETLPAQIGCLGRALVVLIQPWAKCGRAAAIDSTILRARGGVWHKKDREAGTVPHTSIDIEAPGTKSG